MDARVIRSFMLGMAVCLTLCFSSAAEAQQSGSVSEKLSAATESAKSSVQQAGTAAADKISQVWQRIDERRLKNRTRDEIVGWVIMGLLVGALASLLSVLRQGVAHRAGFLLLGLVGAFIGGIVANVAKLDFGMGPVLIRYEDLLVSLVGGLLLVVAFRFYAARRRGQV